MKIIHKGTDPATQPLLGQCNNCQTQIEFLPSEAEFVSDQRDGSYWKIECPICKHAILRGKATGGMYDR